MEQETIAAISTPSGEGGIGIIRISGPDSFNIAGQVFQPARAGEQGYPRSHHLYYGHIINKNQEIIDEVLVAFMREPYTYTREDTVEINCHSGIFNLRMVLNQVLQAGARLAEPGEFTRRAFLNGRIDLNQAESILKLIRARSEEGVKIAAKNMGGRLSRETEALKDAITGTLAGIEATLDFPEDLESEPELTERTRQELLSIKDSLEEMIRGAEKARIYQEGIDTAIIGKPNVGKSSLLNALLRQQRAIVHEVPGTTRDILEGYILLKGYPVRLVDTAGIHGTADPVEQEGIRRSRAAAERACLLLIVLDGSSPWSSEDEAMTELIREGQICIFIINKTDLPQKVSAVTLRKRFPQAQIIKTAAIKNKGIRRLEETVVEQLDRHLAVAAENPLLLNIRHETAAREALQRIEAALDAMAIQPLELVSLELREAWHKLGEITGETVTEALLDRIFSDFCLGK